MYFEELLEIVDREPVFETGLLLAGHINPDYLRRQLVEWVNTGKLWQLRRGLYAVAPPYQKVQPHPFLVANRIVKGSYVSLQAALDYYGHIPEVVSAVTSVTTRRPEERETPLGHFLYRHVRSGIFYGYQRYQVTPEQFAYVASPEKSLLDLVYLQPGGDDGGYLASLRLQNLDRFDLERLWALADGSGKPKIQRAAQAITDLVGLEIAGYEYL